MRVTTHPLERGVSSYLASMLLYYYDPDIQDQRSRKRLGVVRIPIHRTPTHPGEMLQEEFLIPLGLTQRALADAIHVPYQRVNDLVNGRRNMTPSTALRLAKFFGNSAGFWMNLQLRWDLYFAQKEEEAVIDGIQPFKSHTPLAGD